MGVRRYRRKFRPRAFDRINQHHRPTQVPPAQPGTPVYFLYQPPCPFCLPCPHAHPQPHLDGMYSISPQPVPVSAIVWVRGAPLIAFTRRLAPPRQLFRTVAHHHNPATQPPYVMFHHQHPLFIEQRQPLTNPNLAGLRTQLVTTNIRRHCLNPTIIRRHHRSPLCDASHRS